MLCNPSKFPENPFVKWEKLTSIATGGRFLMECWVSSAAGDVTKIDYFKLPYLNAEQFAKFYDCAGAKFTPKTDKNYILPTDGLEDPSSLLTVVTFGDFTR